MAEVHCIDGQALAPSNFAETDEDTNEWKAIEYAGTYGNNGFFFEFENSAALGTDTSGNGNDFTSSGMDFRDQMIDTPQNSTGGNFATLNPLFKYWGGGSIINVNTYSEGALKLELVLVVTDGLLVLWLPRPENGIMKLRVLLIIKLL